MKAFDPRRIRIACISALYRLLTLYKHADQAVIDASSNLQTWWESMMTESRKDQLGKVFSTISKLYVAYSVLGYSLDAGAQQLEHVGNENAVVARLITEEFRHPVAVHRQFALNKALGYVDLTPGVPAQRCLTWLDRVDSSIDAAPKTIIRLQLLEKRALCEAKTERNEPALRDFDELAVIQATSKNLQQQRQGDNFGVAYLMEAKRTVGYGNLPLDHELLARAIRNDKHIETSLKVKHSPYRDLLPSYYYRTL